MTQDPSSHVPTSADTSAADTEAQPPKTGPEHNTKRNLVGLTAASFTQIVVQFLIQVVIAYHFGATADSDTLAAALVIPTILAAIISGSLSYVLVPDLVACFADPNRQRDGARIAGWFGVVSVGVALLTSLVVMATSSSMVRVLYGSLPDYEQARAARLLGILTWQITMSTAVSWSLAVHHSRHSFIVPALGGVVGTLITLVMAWILGGSGIHWIAIAINVGSLISTIIHVVPILPHVGLGQCRVPI